MSQGSDELLLKHFPEKTYVDVPGLCAVADLSRVRGQAYSLNPGRYVGTEVEDLDDEVFHEELARLSHEFGVLTGRAEALTDTVMGVFDRGLTG